MGDGNLQVIFYYTVPILLIQEEQNVSYWRKNGHIILVNSLNRGLTNSKFGGFYSNLTACRSLAQEQCG